MKVPVPSAFMTPNQVAKQEDVQDTKKKSSLKKVKFEVFATDTQETGKTQGTSSSSFVGLVDAMFLNLQDYSPEEKSIHYGHNLLDQLSKIQVGIIMGEIEANDLRYLKETLRDFREDGLSPELKSIVQEIRIRAEVELTKIKMSQQKKELA